jgi:hypothetical protein
VKRVKLGAVRHVRGDSWIEYGPEYQEREREILRRKYDQHLMDERVLPEGKPKESTKFDEENRQVILRIDGIGLVSGIDGDDA